MIQLSSILLVAAAAIPSTLADSSCSAKYPIYVDIHDRSVDGANEDFQYGAFIGVAVPYQNQSLWPSLRRNETSFAAKGFCDDSTLANCLNSTGGTVDFNASLSWREDSNYQPQDSPLIARSSVYGTDDVHLYMHYFDPSPASVVNVTDTPVEYALSGDNDPAIVGLGSVSTILQSLVDQDQISSKSASLYIGNAITETGPGFFNGSLTFGGYDSARMTGDVHTYDMDLSQPDVLPVTIAEIILNDPDNQQLQNVSILDNGTSFEARITTDQYPMLFPAQVARNFANLLGVSNSSDSSDGSFQSTQHFNGTMMFRLSDGLEITLPTETVLSSSGFFAVQDTPADYDGPFYLSTAWLSQVYLTLDYDAKQFHLNQAVLNTTTIVPMGLCANATPTPYNYGAKNSDFVKNGMIGAVIGGLVGGIFLIAMSIYAFVWWKRNQIVKKQNKEWAAAQAWKLRNSDNSMEMRSLNSDGLTPPAKWKGKAPMRDYIPYRDRESSDGSDEWGRFLRDSGL